MAVKTYSMVKQGNNKLSKNFKVSEFVCKDGSDKVLISDELVNILQQIRDHFGQPVIINSAYRTASYNKKIGGASKSQHVCGTAADIVVKNTKPEDVAKYAEYLMPTSGGIGLYSTFTHVDVRTTRYRWKDFGSEVAVSGFPGYTEASRQFGDIVNKLFTRNLISNKQLWQEKITPNSNAYWLAYKCINLTKNGARWTKLKTVNDIVWELGYRGIITDGSLWLKLLEEDKDLYELAYNICNNTQNITEIKKEEPFKYYTEGITHIVEIEPLKISAVETQCSTKQVSYDNFVNGTFFWHYSNGVRYPLGMVANKNEILGNYATHDKAVATLIVYTDGRVEMKYITDITKEKNINFAISGYGIYPKITATEEGFVGSYSDVLRSTDRPIIGYRKKDNKIVIAVRKYSSASRANQTAKNLGLDFAISLDAGGSTTLKVNGEYKFKGDGRKIFGGLIWS